MRNTQTQINIAKTILSANAESDYIGEAVTQLIHAIEAGYFAEKAKHSDNVIIASLFHDIGHYAEDIPRPQMAELGVLHHEWVGARIMRELGFNISVCNLIKNHVDAKRYLAKKKPSYYKKLSAASRGTLKFQGGPMGDRELEAFEENYAFKEIIQVRANDEKAKIIDFDSPNINCFDKYLQSCLDKNLFEKYQLKKRIFITNCDQLKEISELGLNLESLIILAEDGYIKDFQKFHKDFEPILEHLYIEPILNNPTEESLRFLLNNISNSLVNNYVFVTKVKKNNDCFDIVESFENIEFC